MNFKAGWLGLLIVLVPGAISPRAPAPSDMLRLGAVALQKIEQAQNYIPATVLNDAKCLLIIQRFAGDSAQVSALESCRNGDQWPIPRVFSVEMAVPETRTTASGNRNLSSSVILLVLNDQASSGGHSFNITDSRIDRDLANVVNQYQTIESILLNASAQATGDVKPEGSNRAFGGRSARSM